MTLNPLNLIPAYRRWRRSVKALERLRASAVVERWERPLLARDATMERLRLELDNARAKKEVTE